VMEYVDGETLLQRIERLRKVHAHEALRVAVEVTRALEAAAKHWIVHRNVKPGNILIERESGSSKLADFGLAKDLWTVGAGNTSEEDTLGTFRYMAPEQAKDARAADTRSDIYSLGATIFHAIAG